MTKIISRRIEFQGWHKFETIVLQPRSLSHDGYVAEMQRELLHVGQIAVCLPYLPETDEILLSQQFRLGPFIADDPQPYLYECCGGCVDEGETPEEAMKRETLEETGCQVTDFEFIGKAYASPGCSDEAFLIYCGRLAQAKMGMHGLVEEGEEIKTHLLPAREAIRMLDAGEISNIASVVALHWFARNHDRLHKKWGTPA